MSVHDDQSGAGVRLGRELRSWARALLLGVPIFISLWFLFGVIHPPWLRPFQTLVLIGPLLAIGWASRSSVWVLLVWLGPLIAVLAVGLAAPTSLGIAVVTAIIVVWTAAVLSSNSFNEAVFRRVNPLFLWVVDASLQPPKRAAHRAFRTTLKRNVELRQEQEQVEDAPRMIRAFRESGARLQALAAPNSRWKEMFESFASPPLRYADMLEGREPLDYDELKRLLERRDPLLHQLLRDESFVYRVLTYVPRH